MPTMQREPPPRRPKHDHANEPISQCHRPAQPAPQGRADHRRYGSPGIGDGGVVMVGSMYGVVGSYPDVYEGVTVASPVAYQMLKGGIVQMTRHLAVYWANDRVRVNCLSPGPFPSAAAPQELVRRLEQRC